MINALRAFSFAAFAVAGSAAYAAPVSTIWGDSATSGAPILQEWDLNGNLLDTITAPNGSNGRGVVQVGNILYYTSASTNSIFAYNFVTNTDLGTVFSVAGATALSTMAWDGSHFWIGDYSGTNNVYEYSVTGTLLKTVAMSQCTGYCDGLEYANGNLVENEGDAQGPYDVYTTNGTLLHSNFISGHDGNSTTGIAFDGTDYYVSNIYQQTIGVYDSSGNWVRNITLQTGGYPTLVEDLSVNYSQVIPGSPEPSTWAMMLIGFAGIGYAGYRRARVLVCAA
ncbi:MAG TPA: PEP-CTERM sorting domain-containing protein [Roseiarcus sp.]|jgi:hypothetical protein